MKKKNIIAIAIAALVIVVLVIFADRIIERKEPTYIQGTVECKTYKASSKIAGRIDSLLVEEGQHVVKGQLLYTISTPELNAKLIQAEAVRSAAEAMNKKADKGARKPQLEAAKSMWQKADAGLTLAQKTYDRAKALYDKGVVPRQKLDEAQANLDAMRATAAAARARCNERGEGCHGGSGATGTGRGGRGGVVSERRNGRFARHGRDIDRHLRSGRAGRYGLSRGHGTRHERYVGGVQCQGDAYAAYNYGKALLGLRAGAGSRRRVRGYVHFGRGRLRDMERDAYAGRFRRAHIRRQGQAGYGGRVHASGHERHRGLGFDRVAQSYVGIFP